MLEEISGDRNATWRENAEESMTGSEGVKCRGISHADANGAQAGQAWRESALQGKAFVRTVNTGSKGRNTETRQL